MKQTKFVLDRFNVEGISNYCVMCPSPIRLIEGLTDTIKSLKEGEKIEIRKVTKK